MANVPSRATETPIRVLASAYACGPNWGSEIGMGWNWVVSTSQYCQLTVITELDFKKDIEAVLPTLSLKYPPVFEYIDVGEEGRKLFWKQGSARFYKHYRIWQKKALQLARKLLEHQKFDIVHQLNMIGYREPGYLWEIENIPYIIGPVGGYNQFPSAYFSILTPKSKLFYLARNIINGYQMRYMSRPKKAYRRADQVILATPSGRKIVSKYSRREPILIPETGAHRLSTDDISVMEKSDSDKLNLIWVGLLAGRKALPIALQSIAKAGYKNKIVMKVLGDGPEAESYKALAKTLQLDNVTFCGSIPNTEAKAEIAKADMLFFTSVLDATSTVVFEALQSDTPVMCHDTCGFGTVITNSCGIKIPQVGVQQSVDSFSKELDQLVAFPDRLQKLKEGCSQRLGEYYWDVKGKKLFDIYQQCLD